MFAEAAQVAKQFTRPIVTSMRYCSGRVSTVIGAYVAVSNEWAVTAGHVIQFAINYDQGKGRVKEWESEMETITSDVSLHEGAKKKRIRDLDSKFKPDELIRNLSIWMGHDAIRAIRYAIAPQADLGVISMEGVPTGYFGAAPKFRGVEPRMGTSLLRFGYPFHQIAAEYDETADTFSFKPGSLPIPIFLMEGIAARMQDHGNSSQGVPIRFLEVSTPGLRGQSGGPVLDRDGVVWGIQSHTMHVPLGFHAKAEIDGKKVEEHQFLNVGVATDAQTVIELGRLAGVEVETG